MGALRGGVGLVTLAALLAAAEEVDALAIGPGIPRGPETGELLRALVDRAGKPTVIDADGLNALATEPALLAGVGAPLLLTPHPGEMARLCGTTIADVQADRIGIASLKAREWGVTVLLKGARTVVADPEAAPAVIPTGNPGLATGGTGDVLTGLCGALLAGGLPPPAAGRVGAFVHGRAGDLASGRYGERGLVAGDLGEFIGAVWAEWGR
jgi:NAD(P)H-hydrate epimerase